MSSSLTNLSIMLGWQSTKYKLPDKYVCTLLGIPPELERIGSGSSREEWLKTITNNI